MIGFIFAFIYQAMTGMATSALSIPLTGTIQDLLWGLESADQTRSMLAITWWMVSTTLFTLIATQLVRFRGRFSPYRGENMDFRPNITIASLLILGAIMSFLFFLLDLVLGAVSAVSDIHTIYESAVSGDYEQLAVSMLFSIVAGFVVVGIIGRASKVVKITKTIKEKFSKKGVEAKTIADTLGLAPGTLVHVGKKRVDRTWFSVIRYDGDDYAEVPKTYDINECMQISEGSVNWINVTGVHNAAHIRQLGERFGLHELHQADIMNTELRPTLHTGPDSLFMILKMPHFDDDGNMIVEHISLVLGKDHVIAFREAEVDVFDRVRENIRKSRGASHNTGGDYLVYALIDAIVDNFFVIMERVGTQTEELEKNLMSNPRPETLHAIYALKRQTMTLRKIIWPMREVINGLERSDSPLIRDDTRRYLRDVYNHAVQTMDTLESLREMIGGMLDTYLSSVSNKTNEVMKTLTIIASIFIPITFIAGIYGTNFAHIPELEWEGGYFVMLGMMVAVSSTMLMWLRRKAWL